VNIELTATEARLIGCLIEKQITTPDQYPLSLNALTNACNQKSSRDPVMNLAETDVQATLDVLGRKHLVLEKSGFGSRVAKYQHRFCNTEYGTLKFSPQELAVVCELLLRGPQTPGELRGRASRMAAFQEVAEIEAVLKQLMERADGPFIARLAREAGRRESRYQHCFTAHAAHAPATPVGEEDDTSVLPTVSTQAPPEHLSRIEQLEKEVRALRRELDELKQRGGISGAPETQSAHARPNPADR
jgi:uncharacterized protein YceH (UPF0502 family)